MPDQDKCSYQKRYTDIGSKESLDYECRRTALPGGRHCELHSPSLWESEPDRVVAALRKEISQTGDSGHVCVIGFHLPRIDLSGKRFDKQIYFQHTVFHGRADFGKAAFEKEVSFRECVFGQASFEQARFAGKADFLGTRAGHLFFQYAEFSAPVLLSACDIRNGDFRYVRFSDVLIRESEFAVHADFDHAEFGGHCDLTGSSFGGATFRRARFARATISGAKFHKKADFGLVVFERPEDVYFNSDLTHVSFLETDLFRVRFGSDTKWNHGSEPVPYDVREFGVESANKRLADVLSVLRYLRDNYEYRLEYECAGKFFVQEMEMRRRYKDTGDGVEMRPGYWRLLSLTGFYSHLCRYGESFRRPALWMLSLFVGSVAFFSIDWTCADIETCTPNPDKVLYALTRTFSGLFHWGYQELPDYVLRALSIPILGTVFVVLRRRFERRFRH